MMVVRMLALTLNTSATTTVARISYEGFTRAQYEQRMFIVSSIFHSRLSIVP